MTQKYVLLKSKCLNFVLYSIAIDKSTDATDTAQFSFVELTKIVKL
jgi:hypothetical protein